MTTVAAPSVGEATRQSKIAAMIAWLAEHEVKLALWGEDRLQNGSFEIDSDADGVPDEWEVTENGATLELDDDAADCVHGATSARFDVTDSGGWGYMTSGDSGDFVQCATGERIQVTWALKASIADGIKCLVRIKWHDNDQNYLSADDLYDITSTNPTSWKLFQAQAVAPASARYYKLYIQAGAADCVVDGSAYFDGVDSQRYHGPVGVDIDNANNPIASLTATTGAQTVTVPATIIGSEPARWAKILVWQGWSAGEGDFPPTITAIEGDGIKVLDTNTAYRGNPASGYYIYTAPIDVPLDSNYQFTITLASGGTGSGYTHVELIGYEV